MYGMYYLLISSADKAIACARMPLFLRTNVARLDHRNQKLIRCFRSADKPDHSPNDTFDHFESSRFVVEMSF